MKDKINFKEFLEISEKLEIKLGTITDVVKMEKSDKMLKLTVDFGDNDVRTVMTNIGNRPELNGEEDVIDVLRPIGGNIVQLPFVTNLEPVKMMGVVSEAMIIVPIKDDIMKIFNPDNGSTLI